MKISNFLLTFLLLSFVFIACDKNDEPKQSDKETITAKWNTNGTNGYESFEFFADETYMIVKSGEGRSSENSTTIFGTYQIDGNTITLSDFGKIVFSDLKDSSVTFTLTLNETTDGAITISLEKQPTVSATSKTDLLCRAWIVTSDVYIETNAETGEELYSDVWENFDPDNWSWWTWTFTKSGTYIDREIDVEYGHDFISWGNWIWKDNNENVILYRYYADWRNEYIDGEIKVLELTKDKLVLCEEGENEDCYNYSSNSKTCTKIIWKETITFRPYEGSQPKSANISKSTYPRSERKGLSHIRR